MLAGNPSQVLSDSQETVVAETTIKTIQTGRPEEEKFNLSIIYNLQRLMFLHLVS